MSSDFCSSGKNAVCVQQAFVGFSRTNGIAGKPPSLQRMTLTIPSGLMKPEAPEPGQDQRGGRMLFLAVRPVLDRVSRGGRRHGPDAKAAIPSVSISLPDR